MAQKTAKAAKKTKDVKAKGLDKFDEKIIEFYRRHPLAKVAEVAETVHLSRPATQKRVGRLVNGRYLRRGMTADLAKLGFRHRFRVDIKINPQDLGKELRNRKGIFAKTKLLHPGTTNNQQMLAHYLMDICEREGSQILIDDVVILLGDPALWTLCRGAAPEVKS